jgi:hypothetical protein
VSVLRESTKVESQLSEIPEYNSETMRPILLLVTIALSSPDSVGGQALTAQDSSQIGSQVASYFAPYLRASKGADSTNAVCVKLVSSVRGAFLRSLDSSLHRATGGPLVAPLRLSPMRSVKVTGLHRSRDTVFVSVSTSSGGLRAGEMHSGIDTKVPVVRTHSTWSRSKVGVVLVGDGYIRKNKPVPPSPPEC